MWDLQLNNSCNHRIINELLEIKGTYPNYYAVLKRPVYGNNLVITILDQNNLFSENPTLITYTLASDRRTLTFNTSELDVDVRNDVYPKNTYYATYYTNADNCPKCILNSKRTNDVYIDILGRPILTSGFELLIQKVKKILITELESNLFDLSYGSELPRLIGKPKTALTLLKAQATIQNAIDYIKNQQIQNYELLSDEEKLLKIDNFQVLPSNTPKGLKFSFEIYNLAGKNVNIGVSI